MPEFAYTARSATGKDLSGVITAGSKREVFSLLKERALFPVRVDEAKGAIQFWPKAKRIKAELLANNLTQLADLLQNGVSLMAALDVLVEQASQPVLAEVLADVRDKVAEGIPFDHALARHPEIFGELAISMVRAGSEGAFLEDALKRTADFLEMQEEMKGQVVGAMAYPAFLAVAGTVVTVVLIVFFVPKFAELFSQLEKAGGLPGPTIALLWISDFLGNYGLLPSGRFFSRRRCPDSVGFSERYFETEFRCCVRSKSAATPLGIGCWLKPFMARPKTSHPEKPCLDP